MVIDPDVRAAFDVHPEPLRAALLSLRDLILTTAVQTPKVGELIETLKWGEPAYLPKTPRTGTTIRLNALKASQDRYAAYFNCRTTLIASFKLIYPGEFLFDGNRAMIFIVGDEPPRRPLEHCIALALTYHLRR